MSYGDPYKVVMLGGGGVGKSAITIRYIQNTFVMEYDPTIEDTYRKTVRVDELTGVLEVNDTAGQEGFSAMRETWMRYGEGFIFVYSLENRLSFCQELEPVIHQLSRTRDAEIEEIPVVLFGNKLDLAASNRQVETEEGAELAESMGSAFFEGSAKTHININQAFEEIIRRIRADRKANPTDPTAINISGSRRGRGCALF